MRSPKRREIISFVFTCLCITKSLLMYLWQEIYEEAAKLDASDKDKFLELVQTSKIQTGKEGLDADGSER